MEAEVKSTFPNTAKPSVIYTGDLTDGICHCPNVKHEKGEKICHHCKGEIHEGEN